MAMTRQRDLLRPGIKEAGMPRDLSLLLRPHLASEVSDLDVLEAVLSAAAPSRPEAERLAGTLLRTFGSFARVIAAPVGELSLVEGLDRAGVAIFKVCTRGGARFSPG